MLISTDHSMCVCVRVFHVLGIRFATYFCVTFYHPIMVGKLTNDRKIDLPFAWDHFERKDVEPQSVKECLVKNRPTPRIPSWESFGYYEKCRMPGE